MSLQFHKVSKQATIVPNDDVLAEITANLIVKAFTRILMRKENVTFLPSSGRTPIKTYKILAQKYKAVIDWSRITLVQMDEYYTNQLDEYAYFYRFIEKHLVKPLGIKTFISPKKDDKTGLLDVEDYMSFLSKLGPIDFALHGIGRNGHIGFNEPGSAMTSETRIVKLTSATREDNFTHLTDADRPQYGMTLGLKELRAVRHTLLIATGKHKALAIRNLLKRQSVLETPACALWNSPDFGIILDQQAAEFII